jgi:hypothetical protein
MVARPERVGGGDDPERAVGELEPDGDGDRAAVGARHGEDRHVGALQALFDLVGRHLGHAPTLVVRLRNGLGGRARPDPLGASRRALLDI